jgi:hypothetical protein
VSVRVREEDTRTPTEEAEAAWNETFAGFNTSPVRAVEVEIFDRKTINREIEALSSDSSELKKQAKVLFSEENYAPLLSEDDDTSIKRITKEWCESPEVEKSTKVSFSEEGYTPPKPDNEQSDIAEIPQNGARAPFSDEPGELPAIEEDEEELTRQALLASGWKPTQSM